MFSRTHEYALRAALYLAENYGRGPIGHIQISAVTKVPTAYLSKILQTLARDGVLKSKRGAAGGFCLSRSPEQTSVLDVLNAADPVERIETCPLGLASHKQKFCPMHARVNQIQCDMEHAFHSTSLSELLRQPGRPLPLVESELQC